MENEQADKDLDVRKVESRAYLRSLSSDEKVARLVQLQEQYFSMLKIRAANGGKQIPESWQKWFTARHGSRYSKQK